MLGLHKHGPDGRYGAILDIGSGSAGVAIVSCDPLKKQPTILWSYRERMVIRDHTNLAVAEKDITTTVINAILELGNSGIRALKEFDKHAAVDTMLVTVSAPWSHTVSRTVTLEEEEPFSVNQSSIDKLTKEARQQASEKIDETQVSQKFDLSIISDATTSISANGYRIDNPSANNINKLTLSQLVGVTQTRFYDAVNDAFEKVLPETEIVFRTFMHLFYVTLDTARPETSEICLVDITAEATEIGIVRDNVLFFTSHTPIGMYSLARDMSTIAGVPKEEALSSMRTNGSKLDSVLSDAKQKDLQKVVEDYENKIAELFSQTGDVLSIPRTIFLHTDSTYEEFFAKIIQGAAKKATGSEHTVHPINTEFFQNTNSSDSALLLSAHVFHNKLYDSKYLKN